MWRTLAVKLCGLRTLAHTRDRNSTANEHNVQQFHYDGTN